MRRIPKGLKTHHCNVLVLVRFWRELESLACRDVSCLSARAVLPYSTETDRVRGLQSSQLTTLNSFTFVCKVLAFVDPLCK